MTTTVNGLAHEAPAGPTLMTWLREDLGLTSVKDGCADGTCGTCIVVVDGNRPEEADLAIAHIRRSFRPRSLLLRRKHNLTDEALHKAVVPLLRGKTAPDGQVTAYVCQRGSCQAPLVGIDCIEVAFRTNES